MQTQISPQTTVSEALRRDIDAIVSRLDNNRSRAKAACYTLLFEHGVVPKPAFVQTLLSAPGKTANHSTVKVGVQDFWDEVRQKMHVQVPMVDLPEPLVKRFGEFIESFWGQAKEAGLSVARDELSDLQESSRQLVAQANQERDSATASKDLTIEELRVSQGVAQARADEISELKGQAESRARRIEEMAAALVKEEAKSAQLAERLANQEASHIKALNEVRASLDVERASKESLSASLKGEINFAKQQIESARQSEKDARAKLTATEAKLEKLQSDRVALERQIAVMAHQVDSVESSEKSLRQALADSSSKVEDLNRQVHHSAVEIHRLNDLAEQLSMSVVETARALAFSEVPALSSTPELDLDVSLDAARQPVYAVARDGVVVVEKTRNLKVLAGKFARN